MITGALSQPRLRLPEMVGFSQIKHRKKLTGGKSVSVVYFIVLVVAK